MPTNQRVVSMVLAIIATTFAAFVAGAEEPSANALFTWPKFLQLAHSHNDYQQKRPLLDAMQARVTSVEADLFLEGAAILVAHHRGDWRGDFETLYLKPLNQLWLENALPVRAGESFLLWLDLKDGSAALRQHLHQLLQSYPITRAADPGHQRVEVILTGDKASKESFAEEHPSELVSRDSNLFSHDDPRSSPAWKGYALDWKKIGTWSGEGAMPVAEREKLRVLVTEIHAKGRKLRLWNHPATFNFWQEAGATGVDRLGTDLLPNGDSGH
jgi:hypothetical protein